MIRQIVVMVLVWTTAQILVRFGGSRLAEALATALIDAAVSMRGAE